MSRADRTSGDLRTSGLLQWRAAVAEYYFCDCHWPTAYAIAASSARPAEPNRGKHDSVNP
ncbi:undecaprenyl diphosphate synthase family protein [Nannocystis radixulma]|uniref:undecaprenyl diphosphate synthase family protein n=1 Tax=Nannocystis radixulma TaxID=2995305 RepID=UPI00358DCE3A